MLLRSSQGQVFFLQQLICVVLLVSDLLALRSEVEWEEVRQRISDLPQDEALTAEFSKVVPAVLLFIHPDTDISLFTYKLRFDSHALSKKLQNSPSQRGLKYF